MNSERQNWLGISLIVVLIGVAGAGFFLFSHTFAGGGNVYTSTYMGTGNGSSTFAGNIASLADISMVSSEEGWAVGANNAVTNGNTQHTASIILHYSAGQWKEVATPNLGFDYGLSKISMVSATEGWAWGQHDLHTSQVLLHYIHGSWQSVSLSVFNSNKLFSIKVLNNGQLWGSDGTHNFIYNGTSWQTLTIPARSNEQILAYTLNSATEGWAISQPMSAGTSSVVTATPGMVTNTGSATLLHWINGSWVVVNTFPIANELVAFFTMNDNNNGWLVMSTPSSQPVLLRLQGGVWHQEATADFPQAGGIDAFVAHSPTTGTLLYDYSGQQSLLADDGKTIKSLFPNMLGGQPTQDYFFTNMSAVGDDLWLVGTLRSESSPVSIVPVIAQYHAGTWQVTQPFK